MRPMNSFYVLAVDVRGRGFWEHPRTGGHFIAMRETASFSVISLTARLRKSP
jgi:hypothetical protein